MLNAFTRRNFSETQHKLHKAGLIRSDGQPSERGKQELSALLWEQNIKELEKTADYLIENDEDYCCEDEGEDC